MIKNVEGDDFKKRLFESSPLPIVVMGAETYQYIDCNHAAAAIYGYPSPELVLGKKPIDFSAAVQYDGTPSSQMAEFYIRKALLDGSVVFEWKHQRANGETWDAEVHLLAFQINNNQLLQFSLIDITEHKRIEAALKVSEARFRQLADSTFEAIVIHEKGALLDVNASFCTMLGYTRSEVIGMPMLALIAPESKDEVLDKIRMGYDTPYESGIVRKDGTIVKLETIGRPIEYQGRTVRVTAMRDITEQIKAQEALRASERRFKELVRNASDSVTILDKNGIQVYVSDVVEKMLGYTPDELTNIPVIQAMIHPDDQRKVEEAFQKILIEGTGCGEYRHRHKNGTWVHLEAWGTNQIDNPDIRGVVVNVRDVTERVQAAEEREKLNYQINQMQKLESLGLLAGGIAHDFNNLLGGIFGYIDLAKSDDDASRASEYLSKAMHTIDRVRALTGQLLTFAKGGDPLQKTDHLFPFIQETAAFALSGANVFCHYDVPGDLWTCYFDKNQIGQVIDNIVINAQQAMPLGGTIELSAKNISLADKEHNFLKQGDYVKISIKDSGIGIQKELVSKIFDPFFTTKAKGHGLGLATCYSIIKRHEGCIEVESEMGKGSTFHIYLPASKQSIEPQKDVQVAEHSGCGTFLIMDDEEVVRDTLKCMLNRLGYNAVCKENGNDAIEFLAAETDENRKFAGMIFDLTVPGGMGGKEAVAEIRKLDAALPVFVASGYADDPVMKNPVDYGFMASICKPFRMSELAEMLSTYIKKDTPQPVISVYPVNTQLL